MKRIAQQIALLSLLSLVGCQTTRLTEQEQINALRYQTMQNHWQWVTHQLTEDLRAYAERTPGVELKMDTLRIQVYEQYQQFHFSYRVRGDVIEPTIDKDKTIWKQVFTIAGNPSFFRLPAGAIKDDSMKASGLLNQWTTSPSVSGGDPNIHVSLNASQPIVLEHPRPVPIAKNREEDETIILASWVNLTLKKTPQNLVLVFESTRKPSLDYVPKETMFKGVSINGQKLLVDESTIASFRKHNTRSQPLPKKLTFAVPHKHLKADVLQAFFKEEDGWKEFYKRYPKSHGYFSFARVGFNQERTEALLYVEEHVGWLHAGGRYVLFRKFEGAWHYITEKSTWVS
jgi:hypothetical protein